MAEMRRSRGQTVNQMWGSDSQQEQAWWREPLCTQSSVCVCLCVREWVCVCVCRDFHLSSKTTSSTHAQYRLAKAHYFTLWPGHKTTQRSVSYSLRVNGHLGNSLGWFEVWETKQVMSRTLCEECPGTVDRNGASPSVVRLSDLFLLLFAGF